MSGLLIEGKKHARQQFFLVADTVAIEGQHQGCHRVIGVAVGRDLAGVPCTVEDPLAELHVIGGASARCAISSCFVSCCRVTPDLPASPFGKACATVDRYE